MTARVIREYYHPDHQNSLAMGGMQYLSNGNVITGWGWTPSYVEYTSNGTVAMDIQRGRIGMGRQGDLFAYRVFKAPWTGRPKWSPSLAVEVDHSGNSTIYMSWNGATDIAEWLVVRQNLVQFLLRRS
jgi:hypothetical protein